MRYDDNECYERLLWFRNTINTIIQLLTEHGEMANDLGAAQFLIRKLKKNIQDDYKYYSGAYGKVALGRVEEDVYAPTVLEVYSSVKAVPDPQSYSRFPDELYRVRTRIEDGLNCFVEVEE